MVALRARVVRLRGQTRRAPAWLHVPLRGREMTRSTLDGQMGLVFGTGMGAKSGVGEVFSRACQLSWRLFLIRFGPEARPTTQHLDLDFLDRPAQHYRRGLSFYFFIFQLKI